MLRLARMAAAILGASLALWLLSGDQTPDASEALSLSCRLTYHDTYDTTGTQFFELRCPDQVAVLSIAGSAPLAWWLRQQDGKTVTLDLAPRDLRKLER